MTPEEFVASFETVAEAPGGIKRVREMVLGLAVRGLLVPQIADEESVDAVLAKLGRASEKCEDDQKREKELRAGLGTPPEPPWSVPSAWRFVRLEETSAGGGLFCDGDWVESKDQDPTGIIRLTQLADVGDGVWRDRSNRYMNRHTADRLRCTYLEVGDILIARMPDPIGRACIFPGDKKSCATVVDVAVLRLRQEFFARRYVMMAVNSKPVRDYINTLIAGTTRQRVSRSNLASVVIPLPPLAEQKRIVAKVDQLMALCDDLEARQAKKRETAVRLNRAALDALTTAEGPEEVAASFRRIAENFEALVYAPESVGELRRTILELATFGRLVPQDPKEDPLVGHDSLPAGWTRTALHGVAGMRLGKMLDQHKNRGKAHPYLRNTNVHWLRFELDDIKEMPFADEELAEFEVLPGDIMVCEGGHGIGRAAVWAGQIKSIMFQKALHRIRPGSLLDSWYLAYYIKAASNRGELQQYFTGAGILHLTGRSLALLEMRLPPLAEQKRIVAKVDQLMALCDTLEAALRRAESTAQKLAEAVVAAIVA